MFKMAILLYRREDMTHEEFAQWWLEDHAVLARTLPDVRRIVFNLVDSDDDQAPDGFAELWFDSREAMEASYGSAIGQTVAADSVAHLRARVRLPVTEREMLR